MMAKKHDYPVRPGLMLYFELLESLEEYELEERAFFIYAIRDYVLKGIIPGFSDRGLRSIWKTTKPSIDRDGEKYLEKCQKNRYAAYVSNAKRQFGQKPENIGRKPVEGIDYLTFEEWVAEMDSQNFSENGVCAHTLADERQYKQESEQDNDQEYQCQHQIHCETERKGEDEKKGYEGEKRRGGDIFSSAEISELQALHIEAMKQGDLKKACNLASMLVSKGFDIDPQTGELSKRKT